MINVGGKHVAARMKMLNTAGSRVPTRIRVTARRNKTKKRDGFYDSTLSSVSEKRKCEEALANYDLWTVKEGTSTEVEAVEYLTCTPNARLAHNSGLDIQHMTASEIIGSNLEKIDNLDLVSLDLQAEDLAAKLAALGPKTLDLSRLDINDAEVEALICRLPMRNLRWLNLSFNRHVTEIAVSAIAAAVSNGGLAILSWLNLEGTQFNATPYVDGMTWRMSERARQLTKDFGLQRWMMMGSRMQEEEAIEILTKEQAENRRALYAYSLM